MKKMQCQILNFTLMDHKVILKRIEEHAHHFLSAAHQEGKNSKEAIIIIRKYVTTGKITHEEENMLKLQLADTLKIVGIGVPFVLIPGASVIIPIVIKVARKHNIDLLPSVV